MKAAPLEDSGQWRGQAVKAACETDHGHAVGALRYGLLTRCPNTRRPEPVEDKPRARAILDFERELAEHASRSV